MKRLIFAALLSVLGTSALAADTYALDGAHSSAMFRVSHLGSSYFYGRFNEVSGALVFDEADATKSSVNIVVKAASVDTNNEKRDTHLKSADFFDAGQFPELSFKSTGVVKKSDKAYSVTGNLTIHGVTKEVTVDFERPGTAKDPWGGTRTGGEAIFNIKRSDYGIAFMPDGLGDDVRLIVSVEGVKK